MARRWRSMKPASSHPHTLTTAQRGQIVQRVIVDNWTTADAAAAAGVSERLVATWVSDYRRHGMGSLRRPPGNTVAAEYIYRRLSWPLRVVFRVLAGGMRWLLASQRPAAPSPIRRSQDDRGGS
jgi:leucine-zipper of insertion element IS481